MDDGTVDGWGVIERAVELARRGESFAMATVVWRQGPSSSQHGSRAIVTASGDIHGWIGGACAEPVFIREAQRVIESGRPTLLWLGEPDGGAVAPPGVTAIAISCQSEGAMQLYIEPVLAIPSVLVVGRSPLAHTLVELVRAVGWNADLVDGPDFTACRVRSTTTVVVATQGHGDEDVLEKAVANRPAYLGVVASRRRGEALLTYLADRGVPAEELARIQIPAGIDLGHTTHREVAVAVLAELVRRRAEGGLSVPVEVAATRPAEAVDPVCGMTVAATSANRPFDHEGQTYYFCCPGCREAFAKDPAAHLSREASC